MQHEPWCATHSAHTSEELTLVIRFDDSKFQCSVTVPKGTACRKLDGSSDPWIVFDLSFIQDKRTILYSHAKIYGIRIPEEKLENIKLLETAH